MMNRKQSPGKAKLCILGIFTLALTLLCLWGCGTNAEETADSGGIGGSGMTAVSIGDVSEYGSIIVNDVTFDTSRAAVYVEGAYMGSGDSAVREYIPIGRQVVVQGEYKSDNTGEALEVESFYRVRGPLGQTVSMGDGEWRLSVMGQTVYVDAQTRTGAMDIAALPMGAILEISGPVDELGVIQAGHIELLEENTMVGVRGDVSMLNTAGQTFRINDLTIDYSALGTSEQLLESGQPVDIRGIYDGDRLSASSITLFDAQIFETVRDFTIDGFITAALSANEWQMGAYTLEISADTQFEGMAAEDLANGTRIWARGRLQNKVLSVSRITAATGIRLESNVAWVDSANGLLGLEGMAPMQIHISPMSRISNIDGTPATLDQILPGDHVRILAIRTGAQSAKVRSMRIGGLQDTLFSIHGPVTAVTASQFSILGVAVDTSSPDITCRDAGGREITLQQFLTAIGEGSSVRVYGRWMGDRVIIREVAITG